MSRKSSKTPTRAPRPVAKSAQTKYDYVELNKASLASADDCNFYGVIIDATFPYKRDKLFICSLKVIDPTLNPTVSDQNYSTVVIYAQKFEDLPIVQRIGEIIRVHRAKLRIHNGKRQFNLNMHLFGSWVLYSAEKNSPLGSTVHDVPYAYSGQKSTQEAQDVAIVKTLKKWASTFFAKNNVVDKASAITPLKQAEKQKSDFDIVAKVLRVFQLDEYTNELKLKDASGATFYTLALKIKFPHIKDGDAVKIRSCTHDETCKKKVLVLQHYSNIMTFIDSSKLASNLVQKVSDDKSDEKAILSSKDSAPVVLTEVDKKHQSLPITRLHDLFHEPDNSTSTFRTCFYVTKVEPGKVEDCVKSYNKSSKKTQSAKGVKGGDLIYQVQFLVKDVSTQSNNNVYRVLLYTHEGLGANFFPQKAANLWSDSKACGKVKSSIDLLTRYNSWVDCVVERRHGYYFIKDTKMVF